ncbi:MAG: peptidyl-prolyl cis-trans isomerase [Myxococcota bacterium]
MKAWLREPLIQFILLGALLSGIDALRGWVSGSSDSRIVVSEGRIEQLVAIFSKTWNRSPTRSELEDLVHAHVMEELYCRRAQEMGLDQDDAVIRRRLRQKLEFLTESTASQAASDAELQAYLDDHPDTFRTESRYALQQVFVDPSLASEELNRYVERSLETLRAGGDVSGGGLDLLDRTWTDVHASRLRSVFGPAFVEALQDLEVGTWTGPVPSGFGLHLVRIESRQPGRIPPLSEIRSAVEREWTFERARAARREFDAQLLSEYEVEIEWPSGS